MTVFGQEIRENNEKLQSYLANMIEQAGAEDEETLHISRMFAMSYVLEEIRAIRSVALLADEEPEWDTEGDIVRLIALATEPVMRNVEDVISTLDAVITEKTDAAVG